MEKFLQDRLLACEQRAVELYYKAAPDKLAGECRAELVAEFGEECVSQVMSIGIGRVQASLPVLKYYFVELTIVVGGCEKNTHHVVEATHEIQAGRIAMEDEANGDLEFDGQIRATDMHGEFCYTVDCVREIPDEHLPVLKKYFFTRL